MLELKLRGDVWYVMGTIKNVEGKSIQVRKSTGFGAHQKAMAELRLSQILGETVKTTSYAKVKYQETVSELIRIYVSKAGGAGPTNERHLASFEDLYGSKKIGDLTVKDINEWGHQKGHSPAYVRRRVSAVNTMLKYCDEYGVDIPPKLKGVLPPPTAGRKRWLKAGERDRFIEEFGKAGPVFRALAVFLFYTGARVGEALKLKWSDVDGELAVVSSRKGRNKLEKARQLPLIPEVMDALAKLPRRNEYVFSVVGRKPLRYHAVNRNWVRAREDLKIKDFTIHDARHTFASLLGQSGEVELQEIQELLGHEHIQMTLRYKHLIPGKTLKAVWVLSSKFVGLDLHKSRTNEVA